MQPSKRRRCAFERRAETSAAAVQKQASSWRAAYAAHKPNVRGSWNRKGEIGEEAHPGNRRLTFHTNPGGVCPPVAFRAGRGPFAPGSLDTGFIPTYHLHQVLLARWLLERAARSPPGGRLDPFLLVHALQGPRTHGRRPVFAQDCVHGRPFGRLEVSERRVTSVRFASTQDS